MRKWGRRFFDRVAKPELPRRVVDAANSRLRIEDNKLLPKITGQG